MSGKTDKQQTGKRDQVVHAGALHEGPGHSAPYPVSRLAPAISLVDIAQQISGADAAIASHTEARLRVIADQMKALQQEAKKILLAAQQDAELHRAQCSFKRIPGRIYHLYRKANGQTLWSMLSPDDWGGRCPNRFLGSYRLEADQSWTPEADLTAPDHTAELMQRLLSEQGL